MKRAIPLAFGAGLAGAWLMSVCWGSVDIPLGDTLRVLWNALLGRPIPQGLPGAILLDVRLPRTLCVALVGAALSLAGAAMQGLLRNPLADGSTLGVSSGASLGAVIALVFGITIPGTDYGGVMLMAMAFAFGSLVLILTLAYALDRSLSTNSIILIGVIFSMFVSSAMSLLISGIVMLVTVLNGFLAVEMEKRTLLRAFGASKLQEFTMVVFPGALVSTVSALKLCVGMTWVGVIVGEFLVSRAGLGYLIVYGGQVFQLDLVMAGTAVLCLLAALMYLGVAHLEKRLLARRG